MGRSVSTEPLVAGRPRNGSPSTLHAELRGRFYSAFGDTRSMRAAASRSLPFTLALVRSLTSPGWHRVDGRWHRQEHRSFVRSILRRPLVDQPAATQPGRAYAEPHLDGAPADWY
jgi:hypothetical protein